MTIVMQDQI